MSPTPSSNSKKRVQPKRSATTTPSKSPKRSLPQRAKKNNSENKNSNTTPKNSKSKTPTRSGGKRKQPFKVIVNRDSNSNSEKVKPSTLRATRRYSRKDKTAVLPNKNFRVLIKKRVKVISASQQSLILDDIGPDLDTTNINTPSPEGKVPVLKKDQSTIILDGIHEIDLEDLQKKQDESFSEMRSTLKSNTGLPERDTMRSFRSFVKPNSTIMRSKSKIISPTKSFGPIPYDYKSKYDDDDEDGNLYDAQAENKNDITICDLENDNKQDIPNLDIPHTDSEFSKIPDQEIPEPFAQESQPPQIDIENNQSFAELDQDLEFDIGDFTNIPDQSGFINPTEKASNVETSLNDNTLNNNTTPALDQNVLDLDIGDLFSPSNNINVPEPTNFDIISSTDLQVTNTVSEVGANPLNFLLNAENSPNPEPKITNPTHGIDLESLDPLPNNQLNSFNPEPQTTTSSSEVAGTPISSHTNTHPESEKIEGSLPTANLFTATGFSTISAQQESHANIDEPSNSDNSLSQSHNTSQVRKYFAISSDDENESDIHESYTTRKRKQLLESDASEDEELKEDMDFLKDQDVYDNRTRDRKKLSKTALLLEKMKNRKFEFDETDSNEESSNVEHEENYSNNNIKNSDNKVYILHSESSEGEDSIDSFIDKNEKINEEDKQELLDLSMDLSMQTFSIEDSFSVLVKSLVYNYFDPSFLENIYSSPKQSSYYINAINHINRRIDSYKYSLIQSSVWNQRFMDHISTAPICYSTKFVGEIVCQACKKDKHFSTFKLQLSGHKYDNESLQDNLSKIIDETYYLGKFCFHRAQIYHQLHHFAYHLKRKVNSIVQQFNLIEGDEVERAFSKLESDGYVAKWYNEIELIIDSANKSYSTEKVK